MPVYLSRAWLWVDSVLALRSIKIKITRSFDGEPVTIKLIAAEPSTPLVRLDKALVMTKANRSLCRRTWIS